MSAPVEVEYLLRTRISERENGCIEWIGARDADGYGIARSHGRQFRVHREAWESANEQLIPHGMVIMHACDNPPCVNPDHLRIGTISENNRDRNRKGRDADRRGEKASMAKLCSEQIPIIRRMVIEGQSHSAVAAQFGVSRRAIGKIVNRETWAHVA